MDIMLGIIMVLAVVGLIGLGITQMVLAKLEREHLYRLIKSKSFTEYSMLTEKPEEGNLEEDIEDIPVDEIPFLNEEK